MPRPPGPETVVLPMRILADRARLLDAWVLKQGVSRNQLLNGLVEQELRRAGMLRESA